MADSQKSSGSKSHLEYRSAKDGRFKSDAQAAQMRPENVVRERVPKSGYGTADKK